MLGCCLESNAHRVGARQGGEHHCSGLRAIQHSINDLREVRGDQSATVMTTSDHLSALSPRRP